MATRVRYPKRTGRKAVIYLRVSAGEKVQQSLPGQLRIAVRALETAGYTLAIEHGDGGIFKDEKSRGVKREGMHDMLTAVEEDDEVGAIFFWDYRRVWGNQRQYDKINARAVEQGWRLVDGNGADHTSENAMEAFINRTKANMSQLEIETVGERTWDTNKEKAEMGQVVSSLPLGGVIEPYFNEDGQKRTRKLIHAGDMAIARRIFTMFDNRTPPYKIAEMFLAEGVETSKGKVTWRVKGIREIIDNEWYIGKVVWNKRRTVWTEDPLTGDMIKHTKKNPPEQWVHGESKLGVVLAEDPANPESVAEAKALFERCRARRDANGRERPAKVNPDRPLAGRIACGRCGKLMHPKRMYHIRNLRFMWECPYRSNVGNGCSESHSMSEVQILKRLRLLIESEEFKSGLVKWKATPPDERKLKAAISKAAGAVDRAMAQQQRVKDGWREGAYDDVEEFKQQKAAAAAVVRAAEAVLAAAEAELTQAHTPETPELTADIRDGLERWLDLIEDESIPVEIRSEGAAFLDRIEVNNPTVTLWMR